MSSENKALTRVNISKVTLKNRIVFPSICTFFCNDDGTVSDDFREFFKSITDGGVGLAIIPGNPHGGGVAARPYIGDDVCKKDWGDLAEIAHKNGARLFCQLHPAPVFDDAGNRLKTPGEFNHEILTLLTDYYGLAAKRLMDCGVDGVEIEGCHEQYIADFLSPKSNRRSDEYGGSPEKRAKLSLDIIRNIRDSCGADFPISFKISSDEMTPGGRELPETIEIAKLIQSAGADCISVSIGMTESEAYKCAPMDMPDGYNMPAVKAIKDVLTIPVVGLARVVSIEQAGNLIETGMADLVGMGRALLADPALVNKYLGVDRRPPLRCIGCNQGCRTGSPGLRKVVRCTQNPFLGRLHTLNIPEASDLLKQKKIVIVGAGPAGLQAATILAEKGLNPLVFEKYDEPGGLIRLAKMPPFKANMGHMVRYRVERLAQLNVEIKCGKTVDAKMIEEIDPDILIIATGSLPFVPPFKGMENPLVMTGDDAISNPPSGRKVAIIGGGLVGCETAEFLASMGKEIVLFEMKDDIATDLVPSRRYFMLKRIAETNIDVRLNVIIEEIDLPRVVYVNTKDRSKNTIIDGFDCAVVCIGRRIDKKAAEELEKTCRGLTLRIGDVKKPSLAIDAIHDATTTVFELLRDQR
ncbi:MAG: FAD-dependent oxidoreductase [Synergistaceae bacterium]|jgi:2,4-dienoyl-CoA reductase-like NADH-dependent reductase (Old Yellow Enzyme family)/thioredoxin reductase|nr:FAD-dependent oxidoreductase [Synergistaceae bacterium]